MTNLSQYLDNIVMPDRAHPVPKTAIIDAIMGLSKAAIQIADLAATNGIGAASLGDLAGTMNEDGDNQKQLDVMADEIITKLLQDASVGTYFSEEQAAPVTLTEDGALGVACDPLDGSSNIDTNLTIGTIFSLFAMADCASGLPPVGRQQIASGLFVYGPQTSLLLTFGDEVVGFALTKTGDFERLSWDISIPAQSDEFAINASNAAFWPAPVKDYITPRSYGEKAQGSSMRWLGSLVADAYRIFRRGGVFLYTQDERKGYEEGRLRLIYEANPIALLVEAAGGLASTGSVAILDCPVTSLHQRVPLIFGSAEPVHDILSHYENALKD